MAGRFPSIHAPRRSVSENGIESTRSLSNEAKSPLLRTPTYSRPLEDEEHDALQRLRRGIVQIFVSSVENLWEQPWAKDVPSSCTGSGFVISTERRLIITNAHVVKFASTLQVRKDGDFDKHEARVIAVAHQVDLAILTVQEAVFWEGAVALPLGDDPRLQQHIDVVGYPMGGSGVSITSGVVSRIDWNDYSHSQESNLCVTVDAAINSGNSGGPAISLGKVTGVSFQSYAGSADSIGFIIPNTVLGLVLKDFDEAERLAVSEAATVSSAAVTGGNDASTSSLTYPTLTLKGFASFAPQWQRMESEALRGSVGLPAGVSGVLVYKIPHVSNLHGVFEDGDVLISVDGEMISNDGRIQRKKSSPIDFRVAVTMKIVGDPLKYGVFRRGEVKYFDSVAERIAELVPKTWFGATTYCIFAGLVFVPVSKAGEESRKMFSRESVNKYTMAGRQHERVDQQVCVLITILPHPLLLGYEDDEFTTYEPLISVDGFQIVCIADIFHCCKRSPGPYTIFMFSSGRRIVLPTEKARKATVELMKEHRIKHEASADVIASEKISKLERFGYILKNQ